MWLWMLSVGGGVTGAHYITRHNVVTGCLTRGLTCEPEVTRCLSSVDVFYRVKNKGISLSKGARLHSGLRVEDVDREPPA
jgi:hypothetical protein